MDATPCPQTLNIRIDALPLKPDSMFGDDSLVLNPPPEPLGSIRLLQHLGVSEVIRLTHTLLVVHVKVRQAGWFVALDL